MAALKLWVAFCQYPTCFLLYSLVLENIVQLEGSEPFKALESFIRTGQRIRSEKQQFSNSNVSKIEKLLADRKPWIKEFVSAESLPSDWEKGSSFVALVTPSMTGKAQSAFTFDLVKPIYFPLDTESAECYNPQYIYANFRSLAKQLKTCAAKDWSTLNRKSVPTATQITEDYSAKKFWILGFLKKIVEQSNELWKDVPFGQVGHVSWMKFHATRPGFQFQPVSCTEFDIGLFKGFVLMLDEYRGRKRNLLIRNLAIAVGITCILANTNTNIANVVGKDKNSGSSGSQIWSLVVSKLDSALYSVLDAEFGLKRSIKLLKNARPVTDPVCVFLDNYLTS